MVNDPGAALYIIDDIVDTGRTRSEYTTKHQKPFHALVDKTGMFKPYDSRWVVFPWEEDEKGGPTHNIVRLLEYIGEDPDREGLKDTPERVIRAYDEMFRGYKDELGKIKTTFGTETYEEMVLLRDIEFYSTCEHHMMPISGLAHVAYIPDKELLGLSKLARIVDMYSRRLQIQERLCEQITDALVTLLEPKGAACVIRANHMCVSCRGVNKQRATMTTASLKGVFRTSAATRTEFYKMIEQ